jgi:hypothetical protein
MILSNNGGDFYKNLQKSFGLIFPFKRILLYNYFGGSLSVQTQREITLT